MYAISVFVILCGYLGHHVSSHPDKSFNKLYDAAWQCDSVCFGSGGKAEFDPKSKICKCTLDKNIDDADRELILKYARVLNVPFTLTLEQEKKIAKREVDGTPQLGESPHVGQRTPQRIITPRPRIPIRSFSTSRRPTVRTTTHRSVITSPRRRVTSRRPITIQQRLQLIQQELDERRKNRSRNRAGPQLQQRAGFQEQETSNVLERLKEKHREVLEKLKIKSPDSQNGMVGNSDAKATGHTSPVVAASHNEEGNFKKMKEEIGANEKNTHEVIVQDPSLY